MDGDDDLTVLLRGAHFDLPARPGVLDRVVKEIGQRLLNPVPVGLNLKRVGQFRADGDLFVFGDNLVKVHHIANQPGEIKAAELQPHRSGFGFRYVHQRFEHGQDAFGFLHRVRQGFTANFPIVGRLQSHLGGAPQPRHRRAQIVRDIVQGIAHATDEEFILIQHPVEQRDQFVELVVDLARRNPRVHPAGFDDRADGQDQLPDRLQSAIGQKRAATTPQHDDDDHPRSEQEPEADQQCFRVIDALADLQ